MVPGQETRPGVIGVIVATHRRGSGLVATTAGAIVATTIDDPEGNVPKVRAPRVLELRVRVPPLREPIDVRGETARGGSARTVAEALGKARAGGPAGVRSASVRVSTVDVLGATGVMIGNPGTSGVLVGDVRIVVLIGNPGTSGVLVGDVRIVVLIGNPGTTGVLVGDVRIVVLIGEPGTSGVLVGAQTIVMGIGVGVTSRALVGSELIVRGMDVPATSAVLVGDELTVRGMDVPATSAVLVGDELTVRGMDVPATSAVLVGDGTIARGIGLPVTIAGLTRDGTTGVGSGSRNAMTGGERRLREPGNQEGGPTGQATASVVARRPTESVTGGAVRRVRVAANATVGRGMRQLHQRGGSCARLSNPGRRCHEGESRIASRTCHRPGSPLDPTSRRPLSWILRTCHAASKRS